MAISLKFSVVGILKSSYIWLAIVFAFRFLFLVRPIFIPAFFLRFLIFTAVFFSMSSSFYQQDKSKNFFSIEWIWFRKVMLNSIIFKFNGPISTCEMSNRITTQTLVFHFQNNKWMYDVQFHNLNMVGWRVRENVIKCERSLCLFVVSLL